MHPSYTQTKPGTCPICYMDLVLKGEEDDDDENLELTEDMQNIVFSIPYDLIEKFGIKTHSVVEKDFAVEINAYGSVAYDTELYKLLSEYKSITHLLKISSEKERFKDLIESLILKLKIYGIDSDIADKIISRNFSSFLTPSKPYYAFFYIDEQYVRLIKNSTTILINTSSNDMASGKVIAIGNKVDENRKIKLIVEIEEELKLKSNSYLSGKILINLGKRLLIDENAFIEHGDEGIVYVEKEKGKYEMRKIKTGFSGNGYVEVLSGLEKGEKIVSPAFLIDSEARLKGKVKDDTTENMQNEEDLQYNHKHIH